MSETARFSGGLKLLLPALAAASILGYVVQIVVPLWVDPIAYVQFSAFWGALFLCVSALSGVQQEVARSAGVSASTERPRRRELRSLLVSVLGFASILAVVVGGALSLTGIAGAAPVVIPALAVGLGGYSALAVVTGLIYGRRAWGGAALAAVADPALRAVAVLGVAGVAWAVSQPLALSALLLAVVLPFPAAAMITWAVSGRRRAAEVTLDTDARGLLRNSLHTVAAAASLGFTASGLPLVVGIIGATQPPEVVAGLVFLVVLARAPLVSPMLALQSYLTVRFATSGQRLGAQVATLAGAILALAAIGGGLVLALTPAVFSAFLPDYRVPEPWMMATIVGSAALVAVQCVTGPALLGRGQHRAYSAGWLGTAAVTASVLVLPLSFVHALVFALCAGPLIGIITHVMALRAPAPGRPEE